MLSAMWTPWEGRAPLAASVLACALTACSLMVGNDLTGGEDPGASDASSPDGGAGAAVDGGATPEDGGAAIGTEGGVDAAAPCAVKFCDSFEPPSVLGAGWDEVQSSGGTLAYDGAAASAGARSLLATVVPGAAYRRLFLAKRVTSGLTTELRASASVRIDVRELGTTNDLLDVYLAPPPGYTSYDVWVIAGGDGTLTLKGGAVPAMGSASYPSVPVPGLPLTAWTRLELVLRYEPTKVAAELLVAGASRARIELPSVAPGTLRVAVGAPETGGTSKSGWTVRTDDVAIDWR